MSGAGVLDIEYREPGVVAPMQVDRSTPTLSSLPPMDEEQTLFVKNKSTYYK